MKEQLITRRKKVGLALSGGGARGFAHIGVIKVLEANNIKVDMVASTSMGSMVGAFYCAGLTVEQMIDAAENATYLRIFDASISVTGLSSVDKLKQYLESYIGTIDFKDLIIPLRVITTNIQTGKEEILESGKVSSAAIASAALPGIFANVNRGGRMLVDGGIMNILPVNRLLEKEMDYIIAIDTITNSIDQPIHSFAESILRAFDIMQLTQIRTQSQLASIVISPDTIGLSPLEFDKKNNLECLRRGEIAIEAVIDTILQDLKLN